MQNPQKSNPRTISWVRFFTTNDIVSLGSSKTESPKVIVGKTDVCKMHLRDRNRVQTLHFNQHWVKIMGTSHKGLHVGIQL